MTYRLIGFDGDDTLWYHEHLFVSAQERLLLLAKKHVDEETWAREFNRTEDKNISIFGYGVKCFALSLIEALARVGGDHVARADIFEILQVARDMIEHDVEVLNETRAVLETLRKSYRLALITKGDQLEQRKKIERAELTSLFDIVEIVHEKDASAYASLLRRHRVAATRFLMVGNSIRSDILPVLEVGGWAVHVPSELIWARERAPEPTDNPRYRSLSRLTDLPELLRSLQRGL